MSTRTRLSSYAAMAAAGTGAVVGAADAGIVSSSALNGTRINWNTGAGNVAATNVTVLANAGFNLHTRATVFGGGSNSGYAGVVIVGFAPGGGGANMSFLRKNAGGFPFLVETASAGDTAGGATASQWAGWGNINVGDAVQGNSGVGAIFSGTSKYVMFRFDNAGTKNYGWIELKGATRSFSGGQSHYSVTIGDWAYDDSGAYIAAGATGGAVPGLGGLAALAMGAAGVRTRRQR
jgi:hypothetical protein